VKSLVFKITFAILLFSALLYFVDVSELINAFRELKLRDILSLIVLSVVLIWLSALKWQLFIKAGGNQASVVHLMKLYTIGYFFNSFVPSVIGGDVARSYHLGRKLENQKDAFIATFLERFTGLLAMALLGALFAISGSEVTKGVQLAIYLIALVCIVLAAMCFSKVIGEFLFGLAIKIVSVSLPRKYAKKIGTILEKINIAMSSARGNKKLFFQAMLLSIIFHVAAVLNTYVAAIAIGWQNPSFSGLFVVVPLVLLVSMVPITPNGLGIQEGAFLFFLKRIGATATEGLAVGIILRAKVFILALVGGLLLLSLKKEKQLPCVSVQPSI
jgi:uncharacterized protein (TIRG00374 family)